MKLDGKVAIITGGGRGIGRVIALRYAAEGASVVVSGTSKEAVEQTARDIQESGARAIAVIADVSDEEAVKRLIARTYETFGRIDILVNNAGVAGPTAPIVHVTREEWEQTMAINMTGAFLCAKYALPQMIEQQSGRIINITSIAGLQAYALRSPYCASKWAMIGFTQTLAEEAGRYNITANAIAPGPIQGERMERVISARAAQMNASYEDVARQYVEPTALKRFAEEDDIAAMALFLASDEGRNITGETMNISSGYRLS